MLKLVEPLRDLLPAAALAAASLAASPAQSADVRQKMYENGFNLITIEGEIVAGDYAKFYAVASKYQVATVALSSKGGNLREALKIGELIRAKKFNTGVVKDYDCNSSCGLIWLAGTKRFLSRSARVGFHAAYTLADGGRAEESGVANAMVGRYLTVLNLPESAVLFATTAPPNEMNYLTAYNHAAVGIETAVLSDPRAQAAADQTNDAPTPIVRKNVAPPPVIVPAAPVRRTTLWKDVGAWSIASDHTSNDHCFMVVTYVDTTMFRVGFGSPRSYVMLGNPNWTSLQEGKTYTIRFDFPDGRYWTVNATGTLWGKQVRLVSHFDDGSFWDDVARNVGMTVSRQGKKILSLNMKDSAAAVAETMSCERRYQSRKDPFAE